MFCYLSIMGILTHKSFYWTNLDVRLIRLEYQTFYIFVQFIAIFIYKCSYISLYLVIHLTKPHVNGYDWNPSHEDFEDQNQSVNNLNCKLLYQDKKERLYKLRSLHEK